MSTIDRLRGLLEAVAIKTPCRLATTANKTLSGLSAIDSVTPTAGDRILVWFQADNTQNGIYVAAEGAWARDVDFDGQGDCTKGTIVLVTEGTLYGATIFQQTTASPLPGSTAITFAAAGAAALGLASSYMRNSIFPLTTAAGVLTALGFSPSADNVFTGDNSFGGDDIFTGAKDFSGATMAVADLVDLDYTTKPLNSRFFFDYQPPSVRQTVFGGPVDSAGLPTFLPTSVSSSLVLPTQNTGGSYPLIVTAANGVSNRNRDRDLTAAIGSTSWTLANNSTLYLYITVTAPGTFTRGSTTLPPIYQWGGTPATTSGQFTFNISEMRGYMGNGATAPQAYIVFVGEAVTLSGDITSTKMYAYNGRFESAFTTTLPSTATLTTANHNIGVPPRTAQIIFQNVSTEGNYAVGDQVMAVSTNSQSNVFEPLSPIVTSKTVAFIASSAGGLGSPYTILDKTTGGTLGMTLAKWAYKFRVERGW